MFLVCDPRSRAKLESCVLQYSASTDADDGSQACTVHGSLAATTAVRTMDDRRYPDSVCPSVYSERRLPMGSTISVISDPTHMQSDDASRLDCSPSRRSRHPFRRNYSQRRRPVAVAVGFDALEDGGGRTVVITPGQGKTPPRIRESPSSFSSPHRSVVVDHKRSLPSPAPESVPYLPELRLNGASRRVE